MRAASSQGSQASRLACTQKAKGLASSRKAPKASNEGIAVRAGEQDRRNFEADRFRGLEVDRKFELGGLLHRKIARLLATQNAIDVFGGLAKIIPEVDSIGDEPAGRDGAFAGEIGRASCRGGV